MSFRLWLSRDSSHSSGWWLALISKITTRPTNNNNSLDLNHNLKYLSPVITTNMYASYILNYNFIHIPYKTIGTWERLSRYLYISRCCADTFFFFFFFFRLITYYLLVRTGLLTQLTDYFNLHHHQFLKFFRRAPYCAQINVKYAACSKKKNNT